MDPGASGTGNRVKDPGNSRPPVTQPLQRQMQTLLAVSPDVGAHENHPHSGFGRNDVRTFAERTAEEADRGKPGNIEARNRFRPFACAAIYMMIPLHAT